MRVSQRDASSDARKAIRSALSSSSSVVAPLVMSANVAMPSQISCEANECSAVRNGWAEELEEAVSVSSQGCAESH